MTDTQAENGHKFDGARLYATPDVLAAIPTGEFPPVKFGKRDDDEIPHTWASRGLTWLHENRPMVFADMMHAIVGINATAKPRPGK